jgi:hypothetical protein
LAALPEIHQRPNLAAFRAVVTYGRARGQVFALGSGYGTTKVALTAMSRAPLTVPQEVLMNSPGRQTTFSATRFLVGYGDPS